MLQALGLDDQAESVYRRMLVRQDWTDAELAAELGMGLGAIRQCLERLSELRLLRRSLQSPERLIPVTPTIAFQALLQVQQAELLKQQQEFVETQAAVTRLAAEFTTLCCTSDRHEVEHLEGADAVQDRMETLVARARHQCLAMMPEGPAGGAGIEVRQAMDEVMLRNGVKVQSLYLDNVHRDVASRSHAAWLVALGAQVRTAPTLPVHAVVLDDDVALLPIDPERPERGAVQVTGAGVLTAVIGLFQYAWATARPFDLDRPKPADEGEQITAQERKLLCLLAEGLTDEVVSKRLGIGVRTMRRMLSELNDRLGAHSRFETGVRASERGWLQR